ncbi:hypothetical protein ACFYKT_16605 [Cytobacillus sp. FJAT-53684]|uniref:Uncharacterized protein n=1 Tax=Cytobacillus mangrovibacter TaxID=3299024 RepID=A0ABW6K1B2_9BACI
MPKNSHKNFLMKVFRKLEQQENEIERYKTALEEIAYHVATPIGENENYETTAYEFIDISKRALGY